MGEIGDALRDARADLGVDLRQASVDTRISHLFLEALEDERFGDLPAAVYVRGFLRSYASYLGVEGQALIDLLPEEFAAQPLVPPVGFVPGPGRHSRDQWPAGGRTEEGGDPPPPQPQPSNPFPGRRTVGGQTARRRAAPAPPVLEPVATRSPRATPRALDRGDDRDQFMGLLLLGLAALVALGIVGGLVLIFAGGDGDTPVGAGLLPTATSESRTGTVVPPQGSPSATAGATGTAPADTTTSTPDGASPTATADGSDPTAAPTAAEGSTATPTFTPTATGTPTETPTATPTVEPPTSTPTRIPPTPTLAPVAHPSRFAECVGGICGGAVVRVVCAPDDWFVDRTDVNGTFPAEQYGWPVVNISRTQGVSLEDAADAACG